jgi:acylphosphatase
VISCVRCFVSGRVQGVWFRGSTRRQAEQLSLTGYARNLSDGRVEVLACGESDALGVLHKWLWQGPPAAKVSEVECCEEDVPQPFPELFTTD